MLSIQRTSFEDPLDGFGHVEPTPTQGGVEGHDPVGKEPEHQGGGQMPLQIVPDEQHPQGRQLYRQADADAQPLLPAFPL